jgi:hypothetical protein
MTNERSSGKLLLYGLLVVVLLIGLVKIFVNGSGLFFDLEFLGLLFLLLLTILGFIGYSHKWGERVLFFVFLLYILNLLLVWKYNGNFYVVFLVLSMVGFIMSFPNKQESYHSESSESQEPYSEVFDVPEVEEYGDEEISKKSSLSTAKHSPGKFVASKRSNKYHIPKCEWAKKIAKGRRVWFSSKNEALNEGYTSHNCVE